MDRLEPTVNLLKKIIKSVCIDSEPLL